MPTPDPPAGALGEATRAIRVAPLSPAARRGRSGLADDRVVDETLGLRARVAAREPAVSA